MGNANSSSSSSNDEKPRQQDVDEDETSLTQPVKPPAADGKVYFSYADVHDTVQSLVPRLQEADFVPTVLIAIG